MSFDLQKRNIKKEKKIKQIYLATHFLAQKEELPDIHLSYWWIVWLTVQFAICVLALVAVFKWKPNSKKKIGRKILKIRQFLENKIHETTVNRSQKSSAVNAV